MREDEVGRERKKGNFDSRWGYVRSVCSSQTWVESTMEPVVHVNFPDAAIQSKTSIQRRGVVKKSAPREWKLSYSFTLAGRDLRPRPVTLIPRGPFHCLPSRDWEERKQGWEELPRTASFPLGNSGGIYPTLRSPVYFHLLAEGCGRKRKKV